MTLATGERLSYQTKHPESLDLLADISAGLYVTWLHVRALVTYSEYMKQDRYRADAGAAEP